MEIRIDKKDADYLWNVMKIKDNPRADNNDEQWIDDDTYYQLYDYDNIVIKAVFKSTIGPLPFFQSQLHLQDILHDNNNI